MMSRSDPQDAESPGEMPGTLYHPFVKQCAERERQRAEGKQIRVGSIDSRC